MTGILGSIKLAGIVYILCVLISFGVAWLIKGIYCGIRMQKAKAVPILAESTGKASRIG
jgi:ABC-type spermidine/putrescine transport system permease subunit I